MRNNKGMTLMELLVAFAISSIVLTALSYFIFTAIRMYNKNTASVDLQNEAQTALNQIVDNVMEADGIVLSYDETSKATECVLLGRMLTAEAGGATVYYYAGNAIVADLTVGELYLASFPNPYVSGALDYTEAAGRTEQGITYAKMSADSVSTLAEEVKEYACANRQICLMAQNVKWCSIRETDKMAEKLYGTPGVAGSFPLPFALQIELSFEKDYGNGTAYRACSDKAAVRSRIDNVYINGIQYKRELRNAKQTTEKAW